MEMNQSLPKASHFDRILPFLVCTSCQNSLGVRQDALACGGCGAQYPVSAGTLRFVASENYASSFGFEWKKHPQTQLDNKRCTISERSFFERTGFCPEDLRGKWVLDVGCGTGRFAEVATRWGANVIGVDLSVAAEVAAQNLATRNFWAIQASVFELPFRPEAFDFIYSIGVLHHTPDCQKAFKQLPPLLTRGGAVAIWLYSAYNPWYRMSDLYRRLTSRMPAKLLHAACELAGPLGAIHHSIRKIPGIGRSISSAVNYVLPISLDQRWSWRVLDTFDWYSPKYQSKHTYEEVFRWFEDCGLVGLRVNHEPIAVSGHAGESTPRSIPESLCREPLSCR